MQRLTHNPTAPWLQVTLYCIALKADICYFCIFPCSSITQPNILQYNETRWGGNEAKVAIHINNESGLLEKSQYGQLISFIGRMSRNENQKIHTVRKCRKLEKYWKPQSRLSLCLVGKMKSLSKISFLQCLVESVKNLIYGRGSAAGGRASNSNRKFYSRRLTSLSGGYCFIKNPIIEKSMRRSTGTRRRRAKKVMGKKEKKEEK